MASFDPTTPLDAQELDHISDHLNYHKFISLSQSLCIGTPSEDLARQYMENADHASRKMLYTWHCNQVPAQERKLMVRALNESSLGILAETVFSGGCHTVPQGMSSDQHHATGNAGVSNLNMGMALSKRNKPLEAWELDFISKRLYFHEFIRLSQNLRIGTPVEDLVRQYLNKHDCSEILNTWHSYQDPAKGRRLMIQALEESRLTSLAETVQLIGGCHTVPQGMSTDQHHATGNAVVSNLNMGVVKLARQYEENPDPRSETLNTWHSNQDQAKERGSQKEAFKENTLDCLAAAEKVQMGGCHTVPQGMSTDQHHATGNAVVSNLNMGALPGDFLELKSVSKQPSPQELLKLSPSSETPLLKLARQYEENADPCSEMLNTWHSSQDQAKERGSQKEAFNESTLDCLAAEKVQMGGCHTVPQGMSTDQHHATGNAVVSNLNMGALLDDLELKSVSKQPGPQELLKLSTSSETPLVKLAKQYEENPDPCSEMLNTWHSNQDQAKERGSQKEAFKESTLDCLAAEKVQMGGQRTLQPSSAQHPSCPRKRPRPKILQQPDIAPKRIPQQTSFEITEIKLRDVSIKLGAEWRTVGTYLGLNNSQIELMLEEYRVLKQCIFQMLLLWRNTNGVKATKEKFKKALRRSEREDLADFIDEADD